MSESQRAGRRVSFLNALCIAHNLQQTNLKGLMIWLEVMPRMSTMWVPGMEPGVSGRQA